MEKSYLRLSRLKCVCIYLACTVQRAHFYHQVCEGHLPSRQRRALYECLGKRALKFPPLPSSSSKPLPGDCLTRARFNKSLNPREDCPRSQCSGSPSKLRNRGALLSAGVRLMPPRRTGCCWINFPTDRKSYPLQMEKNPQTITASVNHPPDCPLSSREDAAAPISVHASTELLYSPSGVWLMGQTW